jgi:di/tricarboxylate transporter
MQITMNQKQLTTTIGFSTFAIILLATSCQSNFWNAIALSFLMIFFWVFEVIPIYVTALFPLVFAIPLGILSKDDLAMAYGDGNVFLFFGGFLLALGLENYIYRRTISNSNFIWVHNEHRPNQHVDFEYCNCIDDASNGAGNY